jgi:hypothetical protein
MWPDRRLFDLLGIDLPIIQAPLRAKAEAVRLKAMAY